MIHPTHLSPEHSEWKPKRACWFSETDSKDEPSKHEEPISGNEGLEDPSTVTKEDSSANLMDLVENIYVVDDETFKEKYKGIINNDFSDPVTDAQKKEVMEALFKKLSDRSTSKHVDELKKLRTQLIEEDKSGEGDSVLKKAEDSLKKLIETDEDKDQSDNSLFEMLADTVGTLGLNKEKLLQTAKLTAEKKNIEAQLRNAEYKQGVIKKQAEWLKKMEEEAAKKHGYLSWFMKSWEKTANYILPKVGGLGGGVVGTGLGAAGGHLYVNGLVMPAFLTIMKALPEMAIGGGIGLLGGVWLGRKIGKKIGDFFDGRYTGIGHQKTLLKEGKVTIPTGDRLINFKVPPGGSVKVGKDSIVDGKTVDKETVVFGGSIIDDGTVDENATLTLRGKKKDVDKDVEEKKKNLKSVQERLKEHNADVNDMKIKFNQNYKDLTDRIEGYEKDIKDLTKNLGVLHMKGLDVIDENYKNMDQALEDARAGLAQAKKAQDAVDAVRKNFDLNEEYAKRPTSEKALESLYKSVHVDPILAKTLGEIYKKSDEEMRKAQEILGGKTEKELEKWITDLNVSEAETVKNYLEASNLNNLRKKEEKEVLGEQLFLKNFINGTNHTKLGKYLLALTRVKEGTRYASFKDNTPEKILLKLIGEREDAKKKD